MSHAFASTLQTFKTASGKEGSFYSLPVLAKQYPNISRLPISMRIVLESVLRNCDGKKVTPEHVVEVAGWQATAPREDEIPFVVARVVLQDFTGVPLLADFLIGAHAMMQCGALITRDDGFFRDYFKGLRVIVPRASA